MKQEDIDQKYNCIKAGQEQSYMLLTEYSERLKKKLQKIKDQCNQKEIDTQNATQESDALEGYAKIEMKNVLEKFRNIKPQKEYNNSQPPNNLPPKQQEKKEVASFKCKLCKSAYDAKSRLLQHMRFRHPEETKKQQGV